MLLFEGTHADLIYLRGNVDTCRMKVEISTVDVTKYVRKEQLCQYFYEVDVNDKYDPEAVVARARSLVGIKASKLPFKDPHHFVIWCKTGSYQLHSDEDGENQDEAEMPQEQKLCCGGEKEAANHKF